MPIRDTNVNDNGYVALDSNFKSVQARFIGNGNTWKEEQFKWVGKDGYWRLIYNGEVIDKTKGLFLTGINGWTAWEGTLIELYGSGMFDALYMFPRAGAYFELEKNLSDIFQNFFNALSFGGATYQSVGGQSAIFIADSSKYVTPNPNINSGINFGGFVGITVSKNYSLMTWFYVPQSALSSITTDRYWLIFSGTEANHIGVYIDTDKKIKWVEKREASQNVVVGNTIAADTWYSVAVNKSIADPTKSKLYLNGLVQGIMPSVLLPIGDVNQSIYLGAGKKWGPGATIDPQWNVDRTHSAYTIGSDGRTLSKVLAGTTYQSARAKNIIQPNTGKYYWEVKFATNVNSAVLFIGVSETNWLTTDGPGTSAWCINTVGRKFNHQTGGGTNWGGTASIFAVGDIIGVLYNSDLGQMVIYKNGSLVGTPHATGVIGSIPVEVLICLDKQSTVIANFKSTDWTNAPSVADIQPVPNAMTAGLETLYSSIGVYVKNFYLGSLLSDDNIQRLSIKQRPQICLQSRSDSANVHTVPLEWQGSVTNSKMTFTVPPGIPKDQYWLYLKSASFETIKFPFDLIPVSKRTTPLVQDFTKKIDLNEHWHALNHAWGGANGGVVIENIYQDDDALILEAHGDLYTGDLQGIGRDGKPKMHTDQLDPRLGQPWTNRVGGCITLKEKTGYGSYKVTAKIPAVLGVSSAFWTFHYEEIYPKDPRYSSFLAEGLHQQGSASDGHYITRNHEIDIEFPSHLTGGQLSNPSLSNMKCNTWRGELQNWDVPKTDPAYWEEYHVELVPCGQNMGDGLFHEYRIDWHTDRVEFFIDGDLKQTNVNTQKGESIPDIPGQFTFGVWFPSSALSSKPWLVDPAKGWAGGVVDPADGGQKANFDIEKMAVSRFEFIPFDEPGERLIGETYPFGGRKFY